MLLKRGYWIVLWGVLCIGLFSWLGITLFQPKKAPEVQLATLEGKSLDLKTLKGKVVLVNFWATSCSGCIAEMPKLIETYRQFKAHGLEIVAVAMSYDPPAFVKNFSEKKALPFVVALDTTGEAARAFGSVTLTPTTFLVNKKGEILQRYLGEPDFKELNQLIAEQLKEP